jgi:hypothetical protein
MVPEPRRRLPCQVRVLATFLVLVELTYVATYLYNTVIDDKVEP